MKSNKSYLKRLRVTKKGKIIARVPGQNHFNAKRSGNKTRQHHRADTFHAKLDHTAISRFLSK